MFINAGLGVMAIYTQIDWILSLFGARVADYPWTVHVIEHIGNILARHSISATQHPLQLFNHRHRYKQRLAVADTPVQA